MKIITHAELLDYPHYKECAELQLIFNHEVIITNTGCLRWKSNQLMETILRDPPILDPKPISPNLMSLHSHKLDLNALWCKIGADFDCLELMKFYMQIGYSLSGYYEVFGQREAIEWWDDALEPESDEKYAETPIDYVIRKYRGHVLAL